MSNASELAGRLEALEVRYSHQEAAMEELTRTLVAQERLVSSLRERLERAEEQVRALQGGMDARVVDEKPPHY